MLKRILTGFIVLIILSLGFSPIVSAANSSDDHVVVLPKDQTIHHNYFAGGRDVTLSGTVDGDAYVAGGNVVVDGTVNGDLLVAGGNVVIRGTVSQNIRAAGGTVELEGNVGRNVTVAGGTVMIDEGAKIKGSFVSAGGNISVSAPIGKTIDLAGSQVTLNNTVGGDVQVASSQLTFSPSASISGNVTYWSDTDATMASGSQIIGSIHHYTTPNYRSQRTNALATVSIAARLFSFVFYVLIGLFFVFFLSHFTKGVSETIRTRPLASLGWGLLLLVLSPFIFLVLFLTIIGIPIAIIFACWLILSIFISKIFISYLLGTLISKYTKTSMHSAWIYILGLLVYEILKFIPIIGGILSLFTVLAGVGSLILEKKRLYSVLRKEKYL